MAHKTEHAGAKNGGGHHGPRTDAKVMSKKGRRANDRKAIKAGLRDRE